MAYELKITKSGYNVLTETNPKNFIFDSSLNHLKTVSYGSFQQTVSAWGNSVVSIYHGLGYKPLAMAYFRNTLNNNYFITMGQVNPETDSRVGISYNVELYLTDNYLYFGLYNFTSGSITFEVKYEIFYEGI